MSQIRGTTVLVALMLIAVPALAQEASLPPEEGLAPMGSPASEPGEASAEAFAGRVTRASFTSGIVDREPRDSITSLSNDHPEIAFFTELSDLAGHTVSHVWEREGAEMARVSFAVNGPRWRVYSTKQLEPSWTGEWIVRVEDETGRVLRSERFSYLPAAAAASAEAATPASEEPPAAGEELPASIGSD